MKPMYNILIKAATIAEGGLIGAAAISVPQFLLKTASTPDKEQLFDDSFISELKWTGAKGAVLGAGVTAIGEMTRYLEGKGLTGTVTGLAITVGTVALSGLMGLICKIEEESAPITFEVPEDFNLDEALSRIIKLSDANKLSKSEE